MNPEDVGVIQLDDGSAKYSFMHWLDTWSDIQDHLMFLFLQSKGNVLELGVRGGISTSALLYGVETNGGHVWSVDLDPRCEASFKGHSQWSFFGCDSVDRTLLHNVPADLDLLFIDTDHTYERLKTELAIWGCTVRRGGIILIHDVTAFPEMAKAAIEYAEQRNLQYKTRPGSNGLGVIEC